MKITEDVCKVEREDDARYQILYNRATLLENDLELMSKERVVA